MVSIVKLPQDRELAKLPSLAPVEIVTAPTNVVGIEVFVDEPEEVEASEETHEENTESEGPVAIVTERGHPHE